MKAKTTKYRVLCHILVFLLCVGGLFAQTVVQDSAQMVQSTQQVVHLQSEQRIAQNALLLELSVYPRSYATEYLYSLSYERLLNDNVSLRIGATLSRAEFAIPISWHGFIGTHSVAFDIGVGTGVLSAALARRGAAQVVGTDLKWVPEF